jgi:hypothetical protein
LDKNTKFAAEKSLYRLNAPKILQAILQIYEFQVNQIFSTPTNPAETSPGI